MRAAAAVLLGLSAVVTTGVGCDDSRRRRHVDDMDTSVMSAYGTGPTCDSSPIPVSTDLACTGCAGCFCNVDLTVCSVDAACAQLATCIAGCSVATCVDDCYAAPPSETISDYQPIVA